MASSLDVARYLIHLASPSEDEETDSLNPLRLQKLLYYVQGWHLAVRGKALFAGKIEAWTNGPVVKEVYQQFSNLGYRFIPPTDGAVPPSLSEADKTFIKSIWDSYKRYSATALRDMTHQEVPWLTARGPLGPTERSNVEITHKSLRDFFLPQVDEWIVNFPHSDKELWKKARNAIAVGAVKTVQEIRRELRHSRAESSSE